MRLDIRITLMAAIASILLIACSKPLEPGNFQVECNCSIVQLIISPEEYAGKQVRVIGVLIPVSMVDGLGRLYLSKDDARYLNDANSIFVDVRESDHQGIVNLSSVTGRYVVVEGRFSIKEGAPTIDKVLAIRPLPSLPLDNTRFEPAGG